MPDAKSPNLSSEAKKKIEQRLIEIFTDICFNNENVLNAKSESDRITEEIRNFILSYAEAEEQINEVELLIKSKEKGLELVENHDLVFFDEKIDKGMVMRAFLIPGMKVEFTEENASEKVTEDDLQAVDHELCISFKANSRNEFTKLGNLLDIRVTLAKALSGKTKENKEVITLIKQNQTFKNALKNVLDSAIHVLSGS
ncbi:MAG: hypothetical protein A3I68_03175 [Candidatus Melainabacteria bacterium RIFCSPLOWO2_02_FULL_35_15]|nr:MAG: hypothetical protein A3F80_05240 [Candidatus Melainabacteria bacterium RIFCSPLOWO2_12_FULL_35_11]OGI13087.1 MAG: hypothetical protein A3I68_03175 [Candidatus Melainabacteria bacterium RIFCSPLOWO2_02_FULL_35_15]